MLAAELSAGASVTHIAQQDAGPSTPPSFPVAAFAAALARAGSAFNHASAATSRCAEQLAADSRRAVQAIEEHDRCLGAAFDGAGR